MGRVKNFLRTRAVRLLLASFALFSGYAAIPYKPDFVIRYSGADPARLSGIKYTFLDPFDSGPLGEISFAYVDFGTAEDYRRYRNESRYEDPPDFIVEPRPERPHEYFVKPRDPERLAIQRERVRLAASAGFRGVILDNVGTIYEYRNGSEDVLAALYNITDYAHELGLEVVANVASVELIRRIERVDGILREDVYFYNGRRVADERDVRELLEALRGAASRGLLVFVVEYVTSAADFLFVKERLAEFLLFVTDEPYEYSHRPRRYEARGKVRAEYAYEKLVSPI